MIKKLASILFLLAVFFANFSSVQALSTGVPTAIIRAENIVEIDKTLILDASESAKPFPEAVMKYTWDFGDGNSDEGVEVVHSYKEPGNYKVTLKVSYETQKDEATLDVFAYRKAILLISDYTEKSQRIEMLLNYAKEFGVYVHLIENYGSASEFITEEILSKKLNEIPDIIKKSKEILVWTKTNVGLNALSRTLRENKTKISFQGENIVVMQDELPSGIYAERQFRALNPKRIILVKEAAIYPFIESTTTEIFIEKLKKGDYEFKIIDSLTAKLQPLLFVSYLVNSLTARGIPDNTVALILLLPVIATIVSFMKQVVGVTTLGIYTPSILTLIFLVLGLKFGLIALVVILSVGILGRFLVSKMRLLYIPKLAIVITLVSIAILILLMVTTSLNIFNQEIIPLAIFPVMIMATLTEKFINVQTEKGVSATILLVLETVIVAIIAYFFTGGPIDFYFFTIQMNTIKDVMLNFPELIFIFIILNILLGRWTGLRLFEYIRFREIIKQTEEEE